MSRRAAIVGVAAVASFLAGCSSDDTDGSSSDGPGTSATTTPTEAPDATTTQPSTAPTADDGATATPTTTSTMVPSTPFIDGIESTVELLTPPSGSGARPLLSWLEVPGASMYSLAVYAPDGEPYWTWTGPTTSIHVGGEPVLAEGIAGPSIAEGMTWAVIAYDAELVPVAVSDRHPISP